MINVEEDPVVDGLIKVAFILRKKMRKRAADIIDGFNDLYHGSKMFHKDPQQQKDKIHSAIRLALELLSEVRSIMDELRYGLESVGGDLKENVGRFLGMLEDGERILEIVEKNEKKIPKIIDDFYHLNNMMYNMALTIRNDYQLAKGDVYSRKK
jgi:hypothetical protein